MDLTDGSENIRLPLRNIKLGALAAERDADLAAYFVESEAFSRIRSGSKFVTLSIEPCIDRERSSNSARMRSGSLSRRSVSHLLTTR